MMNDIKLNEYLDVYARAHSPKPRRELIDAIMAIPHEVEQKTKLSWNISDWFLFLVPRVSGLTAACVLGLYMGSAGNSALAEDELTDIDMETPTISALEGEAMALLDVEELIFVEDVTQ